jgi:hypothetical protein
VRGMAATGTAMVAETAGMAAETVAPVVVGPIAGVAGEDAGGGLVRAVPPAAAVAAAQ